MSDERHDNAGVIAPPPLIFAAGLLVGLVAHSIRPLRLNRRNSGWLLGIPPILAAFALFATALQTMRNAGTNVQPNLPSTTVVSSGPYSITRNPIYLAMTLLYSGIGLLANTAWPFFLLPLILVAIRFGVIEREEVYLEQKFGPEYLRYKARVRRWL